MNDTPQHLIVLYDEECALCRRCRQWLETQSTHVDIEFLAAGSPAARGGFGSLPWLGADLVVVDDNGNVWAGSAAFIVCLWATVEYRGWSYRLSGRAFAPLAEWFFHVVSSNRKRIGAVVGAKDCPNGRCHHRGAAPAWQASIPAPPSYATYQPPIERCTACGAAVYANATTCWSCGAARTWQG